MKTNCKSTSIVVLLTISMQYDDWKSSTERTLKVPECCYRAVFFTLDHVSLPCFTAVVFSPLCCDPALSVFASKCQGVILCHDGCSLRSRGSWLGGSLVSALSLVASHTLQVAHGDFVFGLVVVLFYGPANMTHKLSSACAEMITSYHLSPQQICFTHKLEPVTSRFCGLVVVFLLCAFFVVWVCFGVVFVLVLCFSVFVLRFCSGT